LLDFGFPSLDVLRVYLGGRFFQRAFLGPFDFILTVPSVALNPPLFGRCWLENDLNVTGKGWPKCSQHFQIKKLKNITNGLSMVYVASGLFIIVFPVLDENPIPRKLLCVAYRVGKV
jgi:hypothetical protein